MILDKQTQLSNAQVLTASAASVNQIDFGPPAYTGNSKGTDKGKIAFNIDADFAGPGGSTLQIGLRSSPNPDMSGAVVALLLPAIPVASLRRGQSLSKLMGELPVTSRVSRYVDVFYTVAGGPFTAGAISAGLVIDQPNGVGA